MLLKYQYFLYNDVGILCQFQFVELLGAVVGERPKRGVWGVRVVGWHRFARQLGGGFNVAALVEAGA